MRKSINLILLFLFVCSCSNRHSENIDVLSMTSVELKTKRVNQSEIIARGAFPFVMVDSMFFLFNGDPSSGAVVLRESDASEIAQFLTKGNGFGECINAGYMGRSKDTLFIYEASTVRKMTYLFSLSGDSLKYECIEDVRPQNGSEFCYAVHRLDNGLSVGGRLIGKDHLFVLLDENLDTITTFGKIPVEYTGSNITTFTGDLLVDSNTVYYASNNFTYMAAYEISNRKPIVKFEKMFVPPVLLNSGDRISFNKNKHLDGFLALKSYKDYLFATYSGKPKAELDLNGSSALVPTTILAFDKSGNPLAKFTTPYKIRSIAFTDEKMYLLDLDCNIESINMDEVLKYL